VGERVNDRKRSGREREGEMRRKREMEMKRETCI
jgi:hypothetical protein